MLRGAARRLRRPVLLIGGSGVALGAGLHGADAEFRSLPESLLPHEYEPHALSAVWSQHPRCVVARIGTIGCSIAPFCAKLCADAARGFLVTRLGAETADTEARQTRRAQELRQVLTDLGPTFIKFGQALSIRPDVLPPPVIYELQKLCDGVPSYPTPEALQLLAAELGQPATELFDGLDADTEPVAAASLGQVYRCRLRGSGEEIALKVQRPDMIRAVSLDLYILRRWTQFVEWFKTKVVTGVFGAADRSPFDVALLDTFARASYLELDYRHEARNTQRFAAELTPLFNGDVYVPRCHMHVTTRKVIATEWIEGVQLAKSPPPVIRRLTTTGVECFLAQLLQLGFFHSDPHPGNMLVDSRGRLVLIDFGLCASIEAFDSRSITAAIVDLMRGDVEALVDDAIALRFLPPDVDKAALLPPLRDIFARGRIAAAQQLEANGGGGGGSGGGVAARRAQFSAISRELNQIFFEFPFTVPEYFALITRALIVLEGIALTGDADFDLFRAAYPYALKHATRLFGVGQLAAMASEAAQAGLTPELALAIPQDASSGGGTLPQAAAVDTTAPRAGILRSFGSG